MLRCNTLYRHSTINFTYSTSFNPLQTSFGLWHVTRTYNKISTLARAEEHAQSASTPLMTPFHAPPHRATTVRYDYLVFDFALLLSKRKFDLPHTHTAAVAPESYTWMRMHTEDHVREEGCGLAAKSRFYLPNHFVHEPQRDVLDFHTMPLVIMPYLTPA